MFTSPAVHICTILTIFLLSLPVPGFRSDDGHDLTLTPDAAPRPIDDQHGRSARSIPSTVSLHTSPLYPLLFALSLLSTALPDTQVSFTFMDFYVFILSVHTSARRVFYARSLRSWRLHIALKLNHGL